MTIVKATMKSGHFDPKKFEHHYGDALNELIKKMQSGRPIEKSKPSAPSNVVNLMDAAAEREG